jgi:hypothetical protein
MPGDPNNSVATELADYAATLVEIQEVMREEGMGGWIGTIGRWLAELERPDLSRDQLCAHIQRSWSAADDMLSLADIAFPNTNQDARLRARVKSLLAQTGSIATSLRCPEPSRRKRRIAP